MSPFGDQKKLFKIVDPLLGRNKTTVLPEYSDPATLASTINTFFIDKIDKIRTEFPLLEVDLPPFSFVDMDSITGFILLQAYKKLSLFMTILAKKIMTFL